MKNIVKNPPHIAIITLNWNGLQDTLECLESVFKNSYPNYSICLIDNASEQDELKQIKAFCNKKLSSRKSKPQLHYLQNKSNLGFAEGNNVGIRKALKKGAEYIFTLNNDTVVDRGFLTNIISFLAKKQTHPPEGEDRYPRPPDRVKKQGYRSSPSQKSNIGIVATTMVNYFNRNKLDNTGHLLLTTGDTIPRGRNSKFQKSNSKEKKFGIWNLEFGTSPPPMGACAGAALYSSEMLKQIGLFDKDFFLNYEDSDLSLRAIVQGWKVAYCPTSIVYHKISASIGKIKDSTYLIRSQRNQLWAYLHNTPFPVIILNLPWIVLRDLLVVVISIIALRWRITWIFLRSRIEILKTLPLIFRKRRKNLKHQKVSSWSYWRHQKAWYRTYWEYFKDIVIRRKPSVMEAERK